ncbi:MAG: hypothetical protein D6797_07625 [Bdellovibrio sp.]|nr:MAG: hypothetical protein D6797_07625 [Bdellovibrio sp.]
MTRIVFLIFWFLSGKLVADELFEINTTVRALGMGNAYTAVVNDGHSLFYNPAGINRAQGYYWTILDLQVGAGNISAYNTLANIQDPNQFSSTLQQMYGENIWVGGGLRTLFSMPYFALTYYDNFDASMTVDNPVSPELILNVINDLGIGVAFGVPLSKSLHVGGTLKRIDRKGIRQPIKSDELANLDPTTITSKYDQKGVGYAADVGVNYLAPGPFHPVVSFVYKNIGNTRFLAPEGGIAPPGDDQEMIVGLASSFYTSGIRITPAIDFKHLLNYSEQIGKKINMGVEFSFPMIDIRGGFHQGYYTYGFSVDLGLFRVEAASYGVELGEYPGQKEDRRYVIQFVMELGLGSDSPLFGGGKGGKKGSRRFQSSRRRGLKQRR